MSLRNRKELIRTAASIHRQFERRKHLLGPYGLPIATWKRCQELLALMNVCHAKHWHAAAQSCRRQLQWALQDVRRELDAVAFVCDQQMATPTPSMKELYAELVAI